MGDFWNDKMQMKYFQGENFFNQSIIEKPRFAKIFEKSPLLLLWVYLICTQKYKENTVTIIYTKLFLFEKTK